MKPGSTGGGSIGGGGGGGWVKPGSNSNNNGLGGRGFGKPGNGGKPSKDKWVKKVVIGAGAVYTGYKVWYGKAWYGIGMTWHGEVHIHVQQSAEREGMILSRM